MSEMTDDKSDLLQGTLDMLILKTLALGSRHGYGISVRIRQLSADVLRIGQGSLYPALYRLERRGWVATEWGESENNRRAKFYRITAAGKKQLAAEARDWERLSAAVARIMETG